MTERSAPGSYDPFDPVVLADPHRWYRWLRAEHPLYHVEGRGYWVVSRWADVHALLRDHGALSSARGVAPEPGPAIGLIGTDPPTHTRLRRIVQAVFTPRVIERTWGGRIQAICDRLVDDVVGAGPVDAFAALTLPLPVQVIAELLGVADGDLAAFKQWSDDMCAGVNQHLDDDVKQRTAAAFTSLCGYFAEQVAERRRRPGDDLITLLCSAGDDERLSPRELIQACVLLLIAGNETTTNLLGNGLIALVDHPAEEAALRARPDRLADAIEEMLRFCPPTHVVFRQSTRAITLHDRTIPADQRVMLILAAANRDEAQFVEPERFWVDRPAIDHLAFGSGVHFCLGSALARLEVRALLATLLARTRAFRSAGAPTRAASILVHGPVHLPMEFPAT